MLWHRTATKVAKKVKKRKISVLIKEKLKAPGFPKEKNTQVFQFEKVAAGNTAVSLPENGDACIYNDREYV